MISVRLNFRRSLGSGFPGLISRKAARNRAYVSALVTPYVANQITSLTNSFNEG